MTMYTPVYANHYSYKQLIVKLLRTSSNEPSLINHLIYISETVLLCNATTSVRSYL